MLYWGKEPHSINQFSSFAPINIGGAVIVPQGIWIILTVVFIAVALDFFYRKAPTGKAMTACAINVRVVSLTGIPAGFMILLAFVISSVTGAVAGVNDRSCYHVCL